jgi:arabinogalactan oligomer/maltooligosaccharide transport system substrate-binding protein
MKKLFALPLSFALALTLAACATTTTERPTGNTVDRGPVTTEYANCAATNGNDACWDATARQFRFEPGAVITIGMNGAGAESYGVPLVEKWNRDFPELAGRVVFRAYGSVNGEDAGIQGVELAQSDAPDVFMMVTDEVLGREVNLLPLHPYFENLIATDSLPAVNAAINRRAPLLLSAFWDGMSFSWNETMLRSLGVNVDRDSNNDGLPDAIDTWEKIFALDLAGKTYKGNEILEIFPISLDEPWSGYSSVSAQGFVLFEEGNDKPGFDTSEFLGGLEFIQNFSQQGENLDETGVKKAASSMFWRWDPYLNDEAYPFSLVGTWQNVASAADATGSTFRFSAMPTYQGNQLRPLSGTKSIGVNAFTNYPSAAQEVLRWMYTPSTMSSIVANSTYLPALQEGAFSTPVIFDPLKEQFTNGMRFNQIVPIGTLPNNTNVRIMDMYYSIGITDFYKAVWDGTLTPREAQAQVVSAAAAWLAANNQ